MTGKEFFGHLASGHTDAVQQLLDLLTQVNSEYCVIGGLAVNAYVEPVVSLDLDIVVAASNLASLTTLATARGLKVERFEHSVNLSFPGSDLRVQFQTDPRYQDFISRATTRQILGYQLSVASLPDVLQGKTWAYSDRSRRGSKRQKDLADIMRLVEAYPELAARLPDAVRKQALGLP